MKTFSENNQDSLQKNTITLNTFANNAKNKTLSTHSLLRFPIYHELSEPPTITHRNSFPKPTDRNPVETTCRTTLLTEQTQNRASNPTLTSDCSSFSAPKTKSSHRTRFSTTVLSRSEASCRRRRVDEQLSSRSGYMENSFTLSRLRTGWKKITEDLRGRCKSAIRRIYGVLEHFLCSL